MSKSIIEQMLREQQDHEELEALRAELDVTKKMLGESYDGIARLCAERDKLREALEKADEGCNFMHLYDRAALRTSETK